MHLSVFERVRVVNLYNDLKGNESFNKKSQLASQLCKQVNFAISSRGIRDIIQKSKLTGSLKDAPRPNL